MNDALKQSLFADEVFTVKNFLTPDQCVDLIREAEEIGFESATVHTAGGHAMRTDWRNNDRVTVDDRERAGGLWQLAKKHLADFEERRVDSQFLSKMNIGDESLHYIEGLVRGLVKDDS